MDKTVLIGVTSGIAAYKVPELIALLREEGIQVKVMMTKHALQMVEVTEFEKACGGKVYTELFEEAFDYQTILKDRTVDHIALADSADVFVIIPATANSIAKLAHGIADDFFTTTALAVTAPTIVCPSMNVNMWNNPVVQENVMKLKTLGYQIVGPTSGMLACGYEGKGRLEEVGVIKDEIMKQLGRVTSLRGRKIIITAGGTKESIDSVRFIGNRSSGKMGIALAEECHLRGADVLLLRAKNAVTPRYQINEQLFETAEELSALIKSYVKSYDILFHAAAVSDFKVATTVQGKLSSESEIVLKLKPQVKILDQIKNINPKMKLIAFKAEYGLEEKRLVQKAHKRLLESNADVIVANDVSKSDRGFEADTNEVVIIFADGSFQKIPLASKTKIASDIITSLLEKHRL